MTVSATQPSVTYVGNSATTVFSYSFQATSAEAIEVVKITIATLEKDLLAQDVEYTIDFGNSEITVLGPALSSSYALEIRRAEVFDQDTSYSTQGNFSPATLEDALDYVTMLVQQVKVWARANTGVTPLRGFSVAALPSALTLAPALIYVWDASGGGIPCFSDGANWRRVDTRGIVS